MTPVAIIQPFAAPGPAFEVAKRPSETTLRPVEPVARARPRHDQPAEALAGHRRGAESFQGHGDRRRAVTQPFRPARPQSDGFLAQAIAQNQDGQPGAERAAGPLPGALARGNEAYRRAGAEPALYADEPAFYRVLA